jgi:hypothetical protein
VLLTRFEPEKTATDRVRQVATCNASHREENQPAPAGDFEFAEDGVQMLFHHRQTQLGVVGDLLVAPALADKLRNFPFALCEPGDAWQPEKPKSPRVFLVSATIFAGDEKMRSRHTDGIDLLKLDRRAQMRGLRMTHLFSLKSVRCSERIRRRASIHSCLRARHRSKISTGIGELAFVRFASSGPFSHTAQNSRAALFW